MSTFFIKRFPHQSLNLRRFRSEQNGAAPVNVGGEELRGLVTALFFADSAHKSRKFTRQLRKFYDKVNANNPRLEVVFVPPRCDKDDGEEMAFGEEHGNWLYLAHRRRRNGDGEAEENGQTEVEHSPPQQLAVPCCVSDDCPACKLLYCYKLNESPYLTLIRPNGDVLYTGAVDDVLECFDRPRCCLRRGRMSGRKAERTVDLWCWLMQHNNQQQQNNFDADWVVP